LELVNLEKCIPRYKRRVVFFHPAVTRLAEDWKLLHPTEVSLEIAVVFLFLCTT